MTFGPNDKLAWTTDGVVRRRGSTFALEMKVELLFETNKYGSEKSRFVTLVCADCADVEWKAFDAGLDALVGQSVRARGIVSPAWISTSDAAAPPKKDGAVVHLGTHLADIEVFGDGGLRPALKVLAR